MKKLVFFHFVLFSHSLLIAEISIRIATIDAPPYSSPELPNGGVYTEITTDAFKLAGYDTEIIYVPWARAINYTKNGYYDVLMVASYREDRVATLNYTDSVIDNELVFLKRSSSDITYNEMSELKHIIVGCMRNTIAANILIENGFKIHEEAEQQKNLELLARERIDLVAAERLLLVYLIQKNYPDGIDKFSFLERPIIKDKLYNVVSRKNPDHEQIVNDFNNALAELKRNGSYGRILKKHGLGI